MTDGLRLCAVCGDRETQSTVCHACRRQLAIDGKDMHYFEVVFTVNGKTDSRIRTARTEREAAFSVTSFYPDTDIQIDSIYQIY